MINEIGADLIVSPSFYFKGSDIKVRKHLTTDDILAKISEYEIFKKYCSNFKEVNRAFCSELRKDRNHQLQYPIIGLEVLFIMILAQNNVLIVLVIFNRSMVWILKLF